MPVAAAAVLLARTVELEEQGAQVVEVTAN